MQFCVPNRYGDTERGRLVCHEPTLYLAAFGKGPHSRRVCDKKERVLSKKGIVGTRDLGHGMRECIAFWPLKSLSPNVTRLEVHAPRIAEIRQPGQFVIVHLAEDSERIPLTIADSNPRSRVHYAGDSGGGQEHQRTRGAEAGRFHPRHRRPARTSHGNDRRPAMRSALAAASARRWCIPSRRACSRRGVRVTSVIGGRSKEWVIFEKELRRFGEVVVCTDDGSYGRKGFVTDAAKEILAAEKVDIVYAVGPVPMMRAVANLTRAPRRPHDRLAEPGDD